YYDAFEAEALLRAGDTERALSLCGRSLGRLTQGEVLLRARTHALAARAAEELGQRGESLFHYESAFQQDPGVFRRLGLRIPVRWKTDNAGVAQEMLRSLRHTGRFEDDDQGFVAHVGTDRICLYGQNGSVLGCSDPARNARRKRS